jgi:DNA-binding response OmpR family regulator
MNNFNVHILSLKSEICSLIRKTLGSERYNITCTSGEEINDSFLDSFNREIDCLVLDKDIDHKLTKKIKNKFNSIPIICLPSLGSEANETKDITYMSEPFKLSELKVAIEEISDNVK